MEGDRYKLTLINLNIQTLSFNFWNSKNEVGNLMINLKSLIQRKKLKLRNEFLTLLL